MTENIQGTPARERAVTIDLGDGPKIAKPIWVKMPNGVELPGWELSDGTVVTNKELTIDGGFMP
jgi:hypothetical protein